MDTNNAATWGAFGDFIGGILNPLVAFFALYWLTRSIKIQREELSATKAELAQAKLAQQDQATTLEKQRFEDTFFSLLNQHNVVLASLTTNNPKNTGNKSDIEYIRDAVFGNTFHFENLNAELKEQDGRCGHYFRILYQLLKLVATRSPNTNFIGLYNGTNILSTLASDEEKLYSNIVRAFLSIDVTQLLAVNCYCQPDSTYWNYKCLVERYAFLEHMPFKVSNWSDAPLIKAKEYFDRRAFGNSEFIRPQGEIRSKVA